MPLPQKKHATSLEDGEPIAMEALLYDKLEDRKVRCALCSHRCVIPEGRRGICSVRENRGGILNTLVYGRLIARHIDPIEKKPLFPYLFHRHGGVQLPLPVLPERRHRPDAG
jgi:hypothetical protein